MTDTVGLILVTGVTGYVASHVMKLLLEEGFNVRGTVRSLKNEDKIKLLKDIVPEPVHPLQLVEADLTKDEGWDKAMEGVSTLIHMASPFPNVGEVTPKEDDIVLPAKEGTLRVLKAAVAAKIKKVVLTSSIVSVFAEAAPDPDKVYSEEDWSDPDSPTIDVYAKSKVIAEKSAWDYLKELPDEEKFDLCVINPSFVLGPVLLESQKSATSPSFLINIMNKAYPAVPKLALNICDVRDVAEAHYKAMTSPAAVGKRHIIRSDCLWYKDIASIVAKEFTPQGYSIATGQLPYFVCWFVSLLNRPMRSYVMPRLGKTFNLDNKRMVDILEIAPTPINSTIIDMAYSLVDLGIVKKAKLYKQVGSRAVITMPVEEMNDKKTEKKTEQNDVKPEEKTETDKAKDKNETEAGESKEESK